MTSIIHFFCIALVCAANGSPLVPSSLPLPGQSVGSTTVCETSPNIVYPYPLNCGYLPYPYPRYPVPINDNLGYYPYQNIQVPTTTVCETTPNVVSILPFPNVPMPNVGSTTICETSPGVVSFLPIPNLPIPSVGSTTVCESTPSVLPVNPCINSLPYPGLVTGYSPYGVPFL